MCENQGCSQDCFRRGQVVWNRGTSINSKTQEREAPQIKILEFFFSILLKQYFEWQNVTHRWIKLGHLPLPPPPPPTSCIPAFSNVIKKYKFSSASLKHRYSQIDIVNVAYCPLVHRCALSNVALFLISLFELKLDFYSVHYHNNTKRTNLHLESTLKLFFAFI